MFYFDPTKEIQSKKENKLIASLIPSTTPQANNCFDCIPGWPLSKFLRLKIHLIGLLLGTNPSLD